MIQNRGQIRYLLSIVGTILVSFVQASTYVEVSPQTFLFEIYRVVFITSTFYPFFYIIFLILMEFVRDCLKFPPCFSEASNQEVAAQEMEAPDTTAPTTRRQITTNTTGSTVPIPISECKTSSRPTRG